MSVKKKIVIGISGASGAIYAKLLLDKIQQHQDQIEKLGVVLSSNAKAIWKEELGNEDYLKYNFEFYENNDFYAPFASGSAAYNTMIVCPCSMGVLGRIAHGVSDDLISRAADVMLKERQQLILVPRETPYNLIHLKNMELITQAGGIICPATPSFYSKPKTINELAMTVVDRILDLAGLNIETFRWNS